jgi:uncharacterized membrane protein affecting hemolysin expression
MVHLLEQLKVLTQDPDRQPQAQLEALTQVLPRQQQAILTLVHQVSLIH